MNIEKLEKLKKSLDNKFIPDNMKDKIRAEIKKLEADIKTDDTMTTTEIKSEVKEIEKEVEKALEVAEKKEEKAEAKTRAKRTTTSRTKKPKVEEKPTAKKKTVFSLAKEIRKADESWDDAKQRARKMMTSQTTETKKKTRTETDKLLAMVRRNKEYKKLAGTSNLSKDAQRRAMPRGKRVSESGNVYYENRANRVDVGGFKSAYLETGGGVGKMKKPTLKKGDVVLVVGRRWFDRANGNTYHTAEVFVNDKYVGKSRMTYGYDEQYIQTAKEILLDSYKLPKGMSDTSPLWQLREYGVILNKTVSDGLKRDLETGGTIIGTPETPLARDLGISYTGLVGETGAMSSGEMFEMGGNTGLPAGTEQHFVNYYLGEGTAQGIYAKGGGIPNNYEGKTPEMLWNMWTEKQKRHFLLDHVLNNKKNMSDDEKARLEASVNAKYDSVYLMPKQLKDIIAEHIEMGQYAKGGGVEDEMRYGSWYVNIKEDENDEESRNQEVARLIREGYFSGFDPSWYLEITDIEGDIDEATEQEIARLVEQGYTSGEVVMYKDSYAKGGGVRMVGGREYPTGRNWTNEHRHIDKADSREVNYTRKKSFDDGGSFYAKGGVVSPFKNMMETNTITEKEINLIKLRMNNDKVDEFTQEAIDFIWDNSPQLTSDQNKKGIDYLRNLWKSPTGKERANNPFGYREEEAIETFEYFELRGFYDAGNRYRKFYVPLYTCVGAETSFEYYISGGEINIVG